MSRLPLLLAAAMMLALGALARAPRPGGAAASGDAAKADYMYLEALRAKSQGDYDAAYSLLSRAMALNSADVETGLELAQLQLSLASSPVDTPAVLRAMDLIDRYWQSSPGDYYTGVRYGLLAQRFLERGKAVAVWEKLHALNPGKVEVSFQLAELLSHGGGRPDRDRAIALLDSIEAVEGPGTMLSGSKIQLHYNNGDTAAIERETQHLLASQPQSADLNVFAGKVYATLGQGDKALQYFDRACELDPSSGLAYFSKAEYYHAAGDSAGFDREVFTAMAQPSLDIDTKLSLLRGYVQEMYADSLQQPRIQALFDTLMVQHPSEHDIHALYTRYLITRGQWQGAAEQQELALGLEPADPEGWELLSSLYLQVEDMPAAKDAITRSLHFYPDDSRQLLMLGSVYGQLGQGDSAMVQYERALKAVDQADLETISRIYTAMGDNMYRMERPDSSYALYRKALQYDPSNTLALNNCAYHMAVEGKDLDQALGYIESVMAVEHDNPTSLDTYAWVLFKRKDYAKARQAIDQALELTPPADLGAELLEHAGDIYFMDGEPDKAEAFWQDALVHDPGNDLLARKVKHRTYFFK